jgi:hypothetical protein
MSNVRLRIRAAVAAAITALLTAAQAQPASPAPVAPFDRTLELQGVTFRVLCSNDSSLNALEIVPAGLAIDNRPISRTIEGIVTDARVADIDAAGSPEIYVFVTSAGSGSYGALVAYAANKRKSLSEIYMRPITDHATAGNGYQGHDVFAIAKGRFIRRFPIYKPGDINARPTGGTRELRYRLVPGEANWLLEVDRVSDTPGPVKRQGKIGS